MGLEVWIGRMYEAITGKVAPPATDVARAIGAKSPCYRLLRDWRKGTRVPSVEDMFFLLSMAEKVDPGFERSCEMAIRLAWWAAAKRQWAGTPGDVADGN